MSIRDEDPTLSLSLSLFCDPLQRTAIIAMTTRNSQPRSPTGMNHPSMSEKDKHGKSCSDREDISNQQPALARSQVNQRLPSSAASNVDKCKSSMATPEEALCTIDLEVSPISIEQFQSPLMLRSRLQAYIDCEKDAEENEDGHQSRNLSTLKNITPRALRRSMDDEEEDDPLLSKYVATPDAATVSLSSSLFATSPTPTNIDSLGLTTSIEKRNNDILEGISGGRGPAEFSRKDYTASPTRHVPFSPSMLLTKYEQHKRRKSLLGARKGGPKSIAAPNLASKQIITGQTKTSTEESSSTALGGGYIPPRKRIRLEESLQSKAPMEATTTPLIRITRTTTATTTATISQEQPQKVQRLLSRDRCLADAVDRHHHNHHRPLQCPPSLQRYNRVSDFLRGRYEDKKSTKASGRKSEDGSSVGTSSSRPSCAGSLPGVVSPPPTSPPNKNSSHRSPPNYGTRTKTAQSTWTGFPLPRAPKK